MHGIDHRSRCCISIRATTGKTNRCCRDNTLPLRHMAVTWRAIYTTTTSASIFLNISGERVRNLSHFSESRE